MAERLYMIRSSALWDTGNTLPGLLGLHSIVHELIFYNFQAGFNQMSSAYFCKLFPFDPVLVIMWSKLFFENRTEIMEHLAAASVNFIGYNLNHY